MTSVTFNVLSSSYKPPDHFQNNPPPLVLLNKGDINTCVFKDAGLLREGKEATFSLVNNCTSYPYAHRFAQVPRRMVELQSSVGDSISGMEGPWAAGSDWNGGSFKHLNRCHVTLEEGWFFFIHGTHAFFFLLFSSSFFFFFFLNPKPNPNWRRISSFDRRGFDAYRR